MLRDTCELDLNGNKKLFKELKALKSGTTSDSTHPRVVLLFFSYFAPTFLVSAG